MENFKTQVDKHAAYKCKRYEFNIVTQFLLDYYYYSRRKKHKTYLGKLVFLHLPIIFNELFITAGSETEATYVLQSKEISISFAFLLVVTIQKEN